MPISSFNLFRGASVNGRELQRLADRAVQMDQSLPGPGIVHSVGTAGVQYRVVQSAPAAARPIWAFLSEGPAPRGWAAAGGYSWQEVEPGASATDGSPDPLFPQGTVAGSHAWHFKAGGLRGTIGTAPAVPSDDPSYVAPSQPAFEVNRGTVVVYEPGFARVQTEYARNTGDRYPPPFVGRFVLLWPSSDGTHYVFDRENALQPFSGCRLYLAEDQDGGAPPAWVADYDTDGYLTASPGDGLSQGIAVAPGYYTVVFNALLDLSEKCGVVLSVSASATGVAGLEALNRANSFHYYDPDANAGTPTLYTSGYDVFGPVAPPVATAGTPRFQCVFQGLCRGGAVGVGAAVFPVAGGGGGYGGFLAGSWLTITRHGRWFDTDPATFPAVTVPPAEYPPRGLVPDGTATNLNPITLTQPPLE